MLMNSKWKSRILHGLEILSDISEIVVNLRDRPKAQDYLAIATRATSSWIHHSDKFKKKPFKGWNLVDIWEYKDYVYDIAKRKFEFEILQANEDCKSVLVNINGINFGWKDYGSDSRVGGPFVEKGIPREDWIDALGKMIWEEIGSNSCEVTKKKGVVEEDVGGGVTVFKVDSQENIYESKIANDILTRSRAFLDNGYNRSIMLYGTPGTGKSSMIRYVAKQFGKHSLRINVGDLDYLSSEDMLLAIEMLKPSTLIIDDFDRSLNPTKFLTELEEFNNHVQLLMVSVNHIDRLDDAVIRPGRFDDIIKIEVLDEKIVDHLIGVDTPEEIRSRLRKLPIAFVVEFHKRKKVLGLEKALEEVVDLEKRIRNISPTAQVVVSRAKKKKKRRKRLLKSKMVEVELKIGNES